MRAAQPGAASGAVRQPRLHSRSWWLLLCGAAIGIGIFEFLPDGIARDAVYQLFGLAAPAAIVAGVRLHRPTRTFPWHLMALGQLSWSIGDALLTWHTTFRGRDAFPSIADPFYLAGYPITALGLYALLQRPENRRDLAGRLDAATVTVALGLLSWVLLAAPTLRSYENSVLAASVAVAYPICDILLIAFVVRLSTRAGAKSTSLQLLLLAIVIQVVVDTAATALDLLASGNTRSIDFLWLVSYALWGAAALHPSMFALSQPQATADVSFTRQRLVALTVAILVAPTILAVERVMGVPLDVWPIVVGCMVMAVLVVARMRIAIEQIVAANKQRAAAQDALAHQAAHDALTELPNRPQAISLIEAALARAYRSGALIALLFIDLDGFKRVNDTLGHVAGDDLLREIAARMSRAVRAGDLVARLGGDEFVVLLEGIKDETAAIVVSDRIVAAVSEPVTVARNREVRVGASIGVAFSLGGGTDPELLLYEADVAVYRAKRSGRGRTEIFDVSLRRELAVRRQMELDLRSAIDRDELVAHFQPIVHIDDARIEGYEALVRWRRGADLLPPAAFIPLAEQSDLICDIDSWMFNRAVRVLAGWNARRGRHDLTMAVNMSARHLARARVVDDVRSALASADIAPSQLVLEITETAFVDDPEAIESLLAIRAMGCRVSIDDFGTGHSTIARLETLPADIVKVDRRFLDPATKSGWVLLRLIAEAAHALGLSVIAEGVEDEDQLELLRRIRCESAQGFFLGRPAEAASIDPRAEISEPALVRS